MPSVTAYLVTTNHGRVPSTCTPLLQLPLHYLSPWPDVHFASCLSLRPEERYRMSRWLTMMDRQLLFFSPQHVRVPEGGDIVLCSILVTDNLNSTYLESFQSLGMRTCLPSYLPRVLPPASVHYLSNERRGCGAHDGEIEAASSLPGSRCQRCVPFMSPSGPDRHTLIALGRTVRYDLIARPALPPVRARSARVCYP